MTTNIKHFKSTTEYAAWIVEEKSKKNLGGHRGENHWSGGSSWDRRDTDTAPNGFKILQTGDESNVDEARKLLEEFQAGIETVTYQWSHAIAGGFPDVPAYLANEPEDMWHLKPEMSDRTPLRIFVGLTSSAGITAKQLIKRGVTLAAFAMAISAKRPVYITPYVNLGAGTYWGRSYGSRDNKPDGAIISWDIRTSPLVLSELLGCLTTPAVTRYLGLATCYMLNHDCNGSWHDDYEDEEKMRQHLGANPSDLWLGSIHLYDPLLRDPIKWLKENIAKYTEEA